MGEGVDYPGPIDNLTFIYKKSDLVQSRIVFPGRQDNTVILGGLYFMS